MNKTMGTILKIEKKKENKTNKQNKNKNKTFQVNKCWFTPS